jgi:hypothetical protein
MNVSVWPQYRPHCLRVSLLFHHLPFNIHTATLLLKLKCIKGVSSRSQWPRGIRYESSSPTRTLGSWVRILLEAWMSACVYSVFALSCVWVEALRRADHRSLKCVGLRNWKKAARAQKRSVEPLMKKLFYWRYCCRNCISTIRDFRLSQRWWWRVLSSGI